MNKKINLFIKKHRKDIIKISLINLCLIVLLVAIVLIFKFYLVIAPFIFIIAIANLAYSFRYIATLELDHLRLLKDLARWLRFIYISFQPNTDFDKVLDNSKNYSSLAIKNYLDKFITSVRKDHSIKPYLEFSANFNDYDVENLLCNLYFLANNNKPNEFYKFYDKFSTKVDDELNEITEKKFNFFRISPIIGASIMILTAMVVTVMLAGAYLYG